MHIKFAFKIVSAYSGLESLNVPLNKMNELKEKTTNARTFEKSI